MERIEEMKGVPMLGAVELRPFVKRTEVVCDRCGNSLNVWDKLRGFLMSASMACVNLRYCLGGKEPTESVGMIEAMTRGATERLNVCAGVTEPHLHVSCRSCGSEWLMRVKGA